MTEAIERARRAAEAGEILGPALDAARAEYLAAMTQIAANEPWETAKITKLAIAQRVVDIVEQHIRAAILSGEVAKHDDARAEAIAAIPGTRRNILQRMGVTL